MPNDELQLEKSKSPEDDLRDSPIDLRLAKDESRERHKDLGRRAVEAERIARHRRLEIERQVQATNEYCL